MHTIARPFDVYTPERAAAFVVANAPAQIDYFGTKIRAKYRTTKPADVEAKYRDTIAMRAFTYWPRLSAEQRARYRCDACGATGCKMWREYNTCSDYTKILCGPCALKDQKKEGPIDAGGYRETDCGQSDTIGWLVPAVPAHGSTFWGYTSVPEDGCAWWRALPTHANGSPS